MKGLKAKKLYISGATMPYLDLSDATIDELYLETIIQTDEKGIPIEKPTYIHRLELRGAEIGQFKCDALVGSYSNGVKIPKRAILALKMGKKEYKANKVQAFIDRF